MEENNVMMDQEVMDQQIDTEVSETTEKKTGNGGLLALAGVAIGVGVAVGAKKVRTWIKDRKEKKAQKKAEKQTETETEAKETENKETPED